jgi:hypothetical protein
MTTLLGEARKEDSCLALLMMSLLLVSVEGTG